MRVEASYGVEEEQLPSGVYRTGDGTLAIAARSESGSFVFMVELEGRGRLWSWDGKGPVDVELTRLPVSSAVSITQTERGFRAALVEATESSQSPKESSQPLEGLYSDADGTILVVVPSGFCTFTALEITGEGRTWSSRCDDEIRSILSHDGFSRLQSGSEVKLTQS